MKSALLTALLAALLSLPGAASAAPLGRVVAMGDSLASGQWLGPQVPGSIADCGQSTGGYPEVAMTRVSHGTWVNATCNGTTADNFQSGWTGPSGTAIPPQYNSLNGNEDLVIVGSGSNEAFFGKIAYDCTGYQPAVDAFFHNRDYPQQTPWPIPNHCTDTYVVGGVNQIPNYVAISKSKIASALTKIHQLSPHAKILLMGKPRIAKPSGSQCFSGEFWLTATDAPLYATWEDGTRQAMIDDVNAFNSAVPGNYAHFVDMQGISGTSHTACETNWSDRWMNPHTYQQGPQYPGIALHNTPLGASVTANAIVDAIHAQGFDTGATPTNPVVSISSPASGIVTTNSTIPVSYSASDNVGISSCTFASGASVALSPGTNTIVVTCVDDAGNSDSDTVIVKRDATPPTISISSPVDGSGTTAATAQLSYTASDDVGTPSCTPSSGTTIALSMGANTLSVSCTDSVGRTSSSSVKVHRGTPPVVAIGAPSDGTNTPYATVNAAYTVDGSATIPGGTSCKVNGTASGNAAVNTVALSVGANAIVVTCTNLFGSGSSSVTVNRGNPPTVAIGAPSDGTNTTAALINVTFTVDGGTSIPGGVTCKVGASATTSTTTNSTSLSIGPNTITVACTNQFGTGSSSITVNRGVVPIAAIVTPADGTNTTAASINVGYTVNGGNTIPAGTTCNVAGANSTNTATNSVSLINGANTIVVVCSNSFGTGAPASVTVNRGTIPTVAITAPANNTNTTADSINAAFTVDGSTSIPPGTTCTVGGSGTLSAATNVVLLALGTNTITISCANDFGTGSAAITVARGVAPVVAILAPTDNALTSAASVNTAFSLNGAASIAAGTSCSVNGTPTSSATTNPVALALETNTITVACSNAFGADSDSVTVMRGTGPSIAITAPSGGLNTTAAAVNLAFTVDGAASIPNGTTCVVNNTPTSSAATNVVALALGTNTIEVVCSNALGDDTQSVVVSRGTPPAVAVIAPADNAKTVASSINVAYTVDGAGSIPAGTDCSVAGAASTSATANVVALSLGANVLSVSCANPFGSTTTTIHVDRGTLPSVAIAAPADGLKTTAASVNVAYTVDGEASIPANTTCVVDSKTSTSTANNPAVLAFGENTITVGCTNSFGSGAAQVTVVRGSAPTVAITAPAGSLNTTGAAINVSYTVDGGSSIPPGTGCTVNGAPSISTSSNNVPLGLGANAIVVNCTNAFDTGSDAIAVTRGNPPSIVIGAPQNGASTSLAEVNVSFAVDGSSAIATGTTCNLDGAPTATTSDIAISLSPGANTIEISCTNTFGSSVETVSVTRVAAPSVSIVSPANGTVKTLPSVTINFLVGGSAAIPVGTACSVGGSPTTTTSDVTVALAPGPNAVEVSCTDAYGGTDTETLIVTFTAPTGPTGGGTPPTPEPNPTAAAITGVTPQHLRPRRSGATFSKHKRLSAAKFGVTLPYRAVVRLSIERLGSGRSSRRVSKWHRIELPGGQSTIYISGRANGRALAPGRYRVRMIVGNADPALIGHSFRITR